MEELKEIRNDVKELLVASTKNNQEIIEIKNQFKRLNGSVANHSKEIGVIKLCLKYNKGIIFGVVGVISVFWSIISYLK